jgi:TolB-like protein
LPNAQHSNPIEFSYSVKTRPVSVWAQTSISVSTILRNGISEIETAAKEMLAQHGIMNDRCGCVKISIAVSDIQKEAIEGVSSSRSFVRSDAVVQIILYDINDKQLYSANVRKLGAGKDKYAAVADGIRKMQLGEILKDIQNAVQNYELQQAQKMSNKFNREKKKIIVLPFIYRGFGAVGFRYYSNYEALSSMLTTTLVNSKAFTVLQRQQSDLAQSDRKYGGQEIQQAKFMGADLAVAGNITKSGETVEVDIRIVDVYTSQIVAAVNAQGKSVYDFKDVSKKLIKKLDIDLPDENEGGTCCK